jgi:Calcium-activated chloride channel
MEFYGIIIINAKSVTIYWVINWSHQAGSYNFQESTQNSRQSMAQSAIEAAFNMKHNFIYTHIVKWSSSLRQWSLLNAFILGDIVQWSVSTTAGSILTVSIATLSLHLTSYLLIVQCQNSSCLVELAEQLAVIMIGKQIINNAQELLVP